MDKQSRMSAFKTRLKELDEREEQARYGAELSLKTKEYHHLMINAEKLNSIHNLKHDLLIDMASLQEQIDDEAREDL